MLFKKVLCQTQLEVKAYHPAHWVHHFTTGNFAVLNGALQRFMGGDGHGGFQPEITSVLGFQGILYKRQQLIFQ